ncbi:MAG: hypothetical protein V5A39_07455 [Haloarculaceae archaeon]
MSNGSLSSATEDLEAALEKAENEKTRYHIRQAAQRIIASEWKES